MPYTIIRRSGSLVCATMQGRLTFDHAERYLRDMWQTLDGCPAATDLIIDGRQIEDAPQAVRQRTEQVLHHPHLGHIAFVISQHHLLIFSPFMRLVSGVGLFGSEQEAVEFLRRERHKPPLGELGLPMMPPRAAQPSGPPPAARPPAAQLLRSLAGMVEGWNKSLSHAGTDHEQREQR